MHRMVIAVNNTVFYSLNVLRVDLKCSPHSLCELMDMLIALSVGNHFTMYTYNQNIRLYTLNIHNSYLLLITK